MHKIQSSIRNWYYRNQRQMRYDQQENNEYSTTHYYLAQAGLVHQFQKFNQKTFGEWVVVLQQNRKFFLKKTFKYFNKKGIVYTEKLPVVLVDFKMEEIKTLR